MTSLQTIPPPSPPTSSWTFTQGFILGQASFLLIVLLFIRYVVFSPADAPNEEEWKQRRQERAKRARLSTTGVPAPPASHMLKKAEYDMATHAAESTDWMNVLFAQILQGYRNDLLSEGGEEGARLRIETWLNPENSKMSWLDPIQVAALSLGNAFPLLSSARIRPSDGSGHIRAEVDIDYTDSVSFSVSTAVLINFPRPRFAVLPVSLGVELVSIGGTLSLELHDPQRERQHLHACLLPDFHLNLKTTTLLGSRAKLQDVPKLEQLIVSRLRAALQDRLVHPHHLSLALPRILSPSISPTPLLNEIGEGAVDAMSDALRKGVGQMMDDFLPATSPQPSQPPLPAYDNESSAHGSLLQELKARRRIHMPAGFPGYTPLDGNTPMATPQSRRADPIEVMQQSRPQQAAATSSARGPQVPSSATGSSQFRFRGQFAGQSTTPGVGGGTHSSHEQRRVGALNARG